MAKLSEKIALVQADAEKIVRLLPTKYQFEAREILTNDHWLNPWGNLLTRIIKDLETAE